MIKFMVAGVQRAGTTLIRTTLDSHPQVRCAGEVFWVNNRRGRGYEGELGYATWKRRTWGRRIKHHLRRDRNTLDFLEWLFSTPGFDAVGFKFMYSQFRDYPRVIDYVKEHQVRVIHVLRRNVFKKLISAMTARARGQFHSKERLNELTRVHVPVAHLLKDLERLERESTRWSDIFEGKVPYMRVAYEDYVANKAEEGRRMLSFLGLEQASIESPLVKLNPEDLSSIIANYDEVKACLESSRFAWCLA